MGDKVPNSIDIGKYLDFCWKYFELQSDQRMKMLQFFISIETLIIGALFTIFLKYPTYRWMLYVVDLSILFTSLSFLGIDNRSRSMIHWCSNRIMNIEASYIEERYQLFNYSALKSKQRKFRSSYTLWIRCYCISIIILAICMFFALYFGLV